MLNYQRVPPQWSKSWMTILVLKPVVTIMGYPYGEPRLHFQWRRQLHLQGRVGVVEPLGGAVAVNGLVCSWRFHGISWIQWDEMRWFLVGKTSPPTMGILHGQQLWNFHEKWWLKQPQMGISWGFDGYYLKNYPGWWSRRIPKSFNLIPFPFANPSIKQPRWPRWRFEVGLNSGPWIQVVWLWHVQQGSQHCVHLWLFTARYHIRINMTITMTMIVTMIMISKIDCDKGR